MRLLYTLLAYLAAPCVFANVLWRSVRDPAYRSGWGERFGFGVELPAPGCIWVHAVSMGEVAAASSLVRAIRANHPQWPVVLTTATPTGASRARELFSGADVDVRYGPYDLPGAVRRFFSNVRPVAAIFMETELWPTMYRECARRGVPRIIANARISTRSWPRYRRLRSLTQPMLHAGVLVAAQSVEDAERFKYLGAAESNVQVSGNLKFDVSIDPRVRAAGTELRHRYLRSRTVWAAGSTHAGEEELVLDAHALVRASVPDALLVLAPRHPNRFDAVASMLARRAVRFIRRSEGGLPQLDTEVVLLDTVGELLTFYAAANAAFVGGSLVRIGGHNLLEPAALGIPFATGPFNANSADVAQLMFDQHAAVCTPDAQSLASAISAWLLEPGEASRVGAIARNVVAANRGALQRIMEMIDSVLPSTGADP